jgi:hypothetical protein
MAGTLQPIAALTAEDSGPINTIFSIILPVTSALIAFVRMATRRKKFTELGLEDVSFVLAFV